MSFSPPAFAVPSSSSFSGSRVGSGGGRGVWRSSSSVVVSPAQLPSSTGRVTHSTALPATANHGNLSPMHVILENPQLFPATSEQLHTLNGALEGGGGGTLSPEEFLANLSSELISVSRRTNLSHVLSFADSNNGVGPNHTIESAIGSGSMGMAVSAPTIAAATAVGAGTMVGTLEVEEQLGHESHWLEDRAGSSFNEYNEHEYRDGSFGYEDGYHEVSASNGYDAPTTTTASGYEDYQSYWSNYHSGIDSSNELRDIAMTVPSGEEYTNGDYASYDGGIHALYDGSLVDGYAQDYHGQEYQYMEGGEYGSSMYLADSDVAEISIDGLGAGLESDQYVASYQPSTEYTTETDVSDSIAVNSDTLLASSTASLENTEQQYVESSQPSMEYTSETD
eukprot:scaffold537_cov205-Alexandrium_tamarense.AAC.5